ncbi:MAG: hypothetical protein MSB80_01380 [Alphaproteobacteria bacterium]|nr:hypothetical protein [Alphaproteobacteria bacterium]
MIRNSKISGNVFVAQNRYIKEFRAFNDTLIAKSLRSCRLFPAALANPLAGTLAKKSFQIKKY